MAAFVAAAIGASGARAQDVALTFDDLPYFGRSTALADARKSTDALLAGLRRHHLPAIGFDNEIQLDRADRAERIALLKHWLDAGFDLGNHTYSHLSLTGTSLDAYIDDVRRGETVTRPLAAAHGRTERWFRHPYLETGPTIAIRHGFEAWLAAHGYRVAPVSMENSDWMFAGPYEEALTAGDAAGAARIRRAYLDFTAHIVTWYRDAARGLLGRDPAFVFLLHASRLNADSIDDLAAILKKQGLHGVTLDRAIRDPAYAISDDYAGPDGDEWLTRWSRTLAKPLPWGSLPQVPGDIEAESRRLDALPPAR